ncbi:hypothetical protein Q9K02_01700 [Qipengyuania sp. G39]|uniref:Uncharacterized protein n=1 Tax=Qipengyuania profundimaris TaxID=3067652 RepID=A0ABT9HL24_9SPHN|nr:hypothetical protein [Qipengyuania sp. G39]MDP4573851.1 hypothetical protein [Qipengyuania sp. G39]
MSGEIILCHTRTIKAQSAVEQHFIESTTKLTKLAADKSAKSKGDAK